MLKFVINLDIIIKKQTYMNSLPLTDTSSASDIDSDYSFEKISKPTKATLPTFTSTVVSVRPDCFGLNVEASEDNRFMFDAGMSSEDLKAQTLKEYSNFKATLEEGGVQVEEYAIEGDDVPDAVFPDWFTTHRNYDIPEGVFILYPMKCPSRRRERDPKMIASLRLKFKHFIDLTPWEEQGMALEGKGTTIFDYRNQKFFTSLSCRAQKPVLEDLEAKWNQISLRPYKAVSFVSHDVNGDVIYHADCMMTILDKHAVVTVNAIQESDRQRVKDELSAYEIVELETSQVSGMCANMFNLVDMGGNNVIIMSDRARRTHKPEHMALFKAHYKVLVADIDTIEYVGGGSARCMLAERF
jgi:hypothetical protein